MEVADNRDGVVRTYAPDRSNPMIADRSSFFCERPSSRAVAGVAGRERDAGNPQATSVRSGWHGRELTLRPDESGSHRPGPAVAVRPRREPAPPLPEQSSFISPVAEEPSAARRLGVPRGCYDTSDSDCMVNGRFQVSIGPAECLDCTELGLARVRDAVLGDNAAAFYFDSWDNPDVLVKVVDGCAVNGHYQVFASSATLVKYLLRIADQQEGGGVAYELTEYDPEVSDVRAIPCSPPDPPPPGHGTCKPGWITLCLQDYRYQLRVEWWTAGSLAANARVVPKATKDSGLFRFYSRESWEILIKVLDGCAVNGHHWVYGASTTDLGYVIRVTDTVTREFREYRNEPGRPAPAITDGEAFSAACGDRGSAASVSGGRAVVGAPDQVRFGASRVGIASVSECSSGDASLCLLDSRYEVTVDWSRTGRRARPCYDGSRWDEQLGAVLLLRPGQLGDPDQGAGRLRDQRPPLGVRGLGHRPGAGHHGDRYGDRLDLEVREGTRRAGAGDHRKRGVPGELPPVASPPASGAAPSWH